MRDYDVYQLEAAFFEAMRQGYATDSKANRTPIDLPGAKMIRIPVGDLVVTDLWQVTEHSVRSFGTTTISLGNDLLWMMHYWGWYQESAISLLKKALAIEYTKSLEHPRTFLGCRGPRVFWDSANPWVYINVPRDQSDFGDFAGREEIIFTPANSSLGWHRYHGGVL